MSIKSVDLNNDSETITHVRFMAWCNRFKQRKTFKKELIKELISVAWHPTRWWDCWMPEGEQKKIKPFFIDKK